MYIGNLKLKEKVKVRRRFFLPFQKFKKIKLHLKQTDFNLSLPLCYVEKASQPFCYFIKLQWKRSVCEKRIHKSRSKLKGGPERRRQWVWFFRAFPDFLSKKSTQFFEKVQLVYVFRPYRVYSFSNGFLVLTLQ